MLTDDSFIYRYTIDSAEASTKEQSKNASSTYRLITHRVVLLMQRQESIHLQPYPRAGAPLTACARRFTQRGVLDLQVPPRRPVDPLRRRACAVYGSLCGNPRGRIRLDLDALIYKIVVCGWLQIINGGMRSTSICSVSFSDGFLGVSCIRIRPLSVRHELHITAATPFSFGSPTLSLTAPPPSIVLRQAHPPRTLHGPLRRSRTNIVYGAVVYSFALGFGLVLANGSGLAMGAEVYDAHGAVRAVWVVGHEKQRAVRHAELGAVEESGVWKMVLLVVLARTGRLGYQVSDSAIFLFSGHRRRAWWPVLLGECLSETDSPSAQIVGIFF
ncbi:hypothetical protein B0H16DRAFT_1728878 [Mycena metata]|uniref:Uncharacterized protein n=1 Tax=Mycena metata TaxID=1033252 RepID=A0AAD7N084_9AGAR|nr:hypothetical protein B0H16DRAFT_1728878 [Mycena metata]